MRRAPGLATDPPSVAAPLRTVRRLGAGRRCVAWLAWWGTRLVVVKRFAGAAVAKHSARHGTPLALFEYRRNRALHGIAPLARHVAEPLAWVATDAHQLLLQAYVDGEPLDRFAPAASREERGRICDDLARVVAGAHAAGVFDLDLHPRNVLVRRSRDGTPSAVLFDFNKIPYHEWPPNALARWLVGRRWIRPESRDRRRLDALTRRLRPSRLDCATPILLSPQI